jgi:hypothetical protein
LNFYFIAKKHVMDLKKMPNTAPSDSYAMGAQPSAAAKPAAIADEVKLLDFLDSLTSLQDDWDGEGSASPNKEAVLGAKQFTVNLFHHFPDSKVEQACPGPMGEIVIELRNGEKSVEFLFYPNKKWKYVSVGGKRLPEQGVFEMKNLSKLITWLHETEL